MTPFFMIRRKSDGKTDNIYEYDFKNNIFVGSSRSYKYADIDTFIGVPSDVLMNIFKEDRKTSKKNEEVSD